MAKNDIHVGYKSAIADDDDPQTNDFSLGCANISMFHEHKVPSEAMLIILCAFWVPITVTATTGCKLAQEVSGLRWTGVRLFTLIIYKN